LPRLRSREGLHALAVAARGQFEAMYRAIQSANMKPVIDEVLPMEAAAGAFNLMDRGRHFGKIVLKVGLTQFASRKRSDRFRPLLDPVPRAA
jgi:hypothetical protein